MSTTSHSSRLSLNSTLGSARRVSVLPSESAFVRHSIPSSELLVRILSNTTCQPLSLKNFQDYLQYKEYSTENLLFWNWYKRYRLRFQNLEENERALSAAPTSSAQMPDLTQVPNLKIMNGDEIAGGDFMRSSTLTTADLSSLATVGSSIQPFRREIDLVVSKFLGSNGAYELNVTPSVRKRTVEQSKKSTHPDVFKDAAEEAYQLMRTSSLPNFVKYATSNINRPKRNFWLYVGTTDFLIGFLIYFLCIFLKAGRGFRVFGVPFTWFGCMQFYSATQGLCFQVYGRHARQLYPWDLEAISTNASTAEKDLETQNGSQDLDFESVDGASRERGMRIFRKSRIFEEEIPIEDEYVKKVQRARYIRTWVVASTMAAVFIAIFLAVPNLPA